MFVVRIGFIVSCYIGLTLTFDGAPTDGRESMGERLLSNDLHKVNHLKYIIMPNQECGQVTSYINSII